MTTNPQVNEARRVNLGVQVTFNTVRNATEILVEMMEEVYKKNKGSTDKEIVERLRSMGRRMASSYASYWIPKREGVEAMLISIYKNVFGSNVTIEEPADRKTTRKDFPMKKVYDVIDQGCPLCKVKRQTNIAPCEIITGMVEGLFEQMAGETPDLKAESVLETRSRGDDRCKHRYVLDRQER
jgi:predicted hydrocarbon binding protein